MNLYCPRCWGINEWGGEVCDRCGAPMRGPEEETYMQKLIWALHHPEAATALRAATILGDLRAPEATDTLIEVLDASAKDPYLGAAAARGLGTIGDPESRTALITALACGPVAVRLAAVEALEKLGPNEKSVEALRRAMEDRSERVGDSATQVLAAWGS